MKLKIVLSIVLVCVIAISAISLMKTGSNLSELTLSNVDALARGEDPDNATCCKEDNRECVTSQVTIVDYYRQNDGPCPKR